MATTHSSFDSVRTHLAARGAASSTPALRKDVEILIRRCDEVRSLGHEFGGVEVSPYVSALLGMPPATPARIALPAVASV